MTRMALTARQTAVLAVIRESVASRGYPPTLTEIGKAVGLASRGSVHRQLLILELKGAIERDASTSRGIRLVDGGGAP